MPVISESLLILPNSWDILLLHENFFDVFFSGIYAFIPLFFYFMDNKQIKCQVVYSGSTIKKCFWQSASFFLEE